METPSPLVEEAPPSDSKATLPDPGTPPPPVSVETSTFSVPAASVPPARELTTDPSPAISAPPDADPEIAVADGARALERTERRLRRLERELTERDSRIEALQQTVSQRTRERNEAREAALDAQRLVRARQRELRLAAAEVARLTDSSNRAKSQIVSLREKAQTFQEELQQARSGSGAQILMDETIRAWLISESGGKAFRPSQDVVVIGHGFLDEASFARVLKSRGHRVVTAGTASAETVVVGRDDWWIDDLEAAIRARWGRSLRIYSQEMFLAALATGNDPLDASKRTLMAFANGHPTLEYLINSGFKWPRVFAGKPGEGPPPQSPEVPESPLHVLGYRAGKQAGTAEPVRRAALKKCFQSPQLPFVQSRDYMATWGTPSSRDRLRRMANHVAWLARLWRKSPSHDIAVKHWTRDLDWLYDEFYEDWMRFRWPELLV